MKKISTHIDFATSCSFGCIGLEAIGATSGTVVVLSFDMGISETRPRFGRKSFGRAQSRSVASSVRDEFEARSCLPHEVGGDASPRKTQDFSPEYH
jgi:hypothetical protein